MANFMARLVTGALPLFGGLSQEKTNGKSILGTTDMEPLPGFLPSSQLTAGFPWGNRTYKGGNEELPVTGETRHYTFNISRAAMSPDGFEKEMMVINDQFPGPLIEANWGDWIEVEVINSLGVPEEGTTVHWHGFRQQETPWYDGVPSVQQCPIAPGKSFTYTFRADHVGSSFYHSHYSAQTSAGLFGPMVIYGPPNQDYDHDLGPVLVTDWFHKEYQALVEDVMSAGNETRIAPSSQNNLINGKMNFDCSLMGDDTPCVSDAGISKFVFEPEDTHLLRIVNGGAAGLQYFSIDEHNMTVISIDFIPVEPYETNNLILGVGQRSDVLVKGKPRSELQDHQAFYMRSELSPSCAIPDQPLALAAIYYSQEDASADPAITPQSTPQTFELDRYGCGNEPLPLTQPLFPLESTTSALAELAEDPTTREPDTTIQIDIKWTLNATSQQEWLLNNQTFHGNFNHPILREAFQGNTSYPSDPQWNVYNTGSNRTVRIVWENDKNSSVTRAHPMHMHGHDYQILSAGQGAWDGTIDEDYARNPLRRDTHMLPLGGHLVVQFEADNPGIWPFHCHVAWHVSSGFYVNIMERPEDLVGKGDIDGIVGETCVDWDAWSTENVVNQIDSGLRLIKEGI